MPIPEALLTRVEPWLAPISPARPEGDAVAYTDAFERLSSEVAKLDSPSAGPPDWRRVRDEAIALTVDASKDLVVASYLCVALIELEGRAGVETSLVFLRELCRRYWPRMYPEARHAKRRVNALGSVVERMVATVPVARTEGDGLERTIALVDELRSALRERESYAVDYAAVFGPLRYALREGNSGYYLGSHWERAENEPGRLRCEAAERASTPSERLAELARDAVPEVRAKVAANPSAPSDVLALLADDPESDVRRAVAAHPATPEGVLAGLVGDPSESVRSAVARRGGGGRAGRARLAGDASHLVRGALAGHPETEPEVLTALARDEEVYPRFQVAYHARTPKAVLTALGSDPHRSVRIGVACNPRTPEPVQAKLARDADSEVRYWVTQNPTAPAEALRALARDADGEVRTGGWERLASVWDTNPGSSRASSR